MRILPESLEHKMPQTVLVTGASRGIGLGLVRVLAGAGYRVVATCRSPARAADLAQLLRAAGQAPAVALDVASDQSVEQLRCYLETNRGNTDIFTSLLVFIFIC